VVASDSRSERVERASFWWEDC